MGEPNSYGTPGRAKRIIKEKKEDMSTLAKESNPKN